VCSCPKFDTPQSSGVVALPAALSADLTLQCRGLKLNSWRTTALRSLAPTHTCLEVSIDPEDLDYLDQVCLIRVGAKLCRAMALQELSLRPLL